MKPTMNFVAEVSVDIFNESKNVEATNVFRLAGQAIDVLIKAPISTATVRFVDDGVDCLALPLGDYYVGYSIRDEVINIIAVLEK